jgi:DNA-binding transcriptional LysR family regulator
MEAAGVAAELRVDPGVVSRRLAELRTGYGLLKKHGNHHVLTGKGQEALPAVRALLRQYDQLLEWLAGRQEHGEVVTVATGSLGARLYLARALVQFGSLQPGWEVRALVRRGRERILGTATGRFDVAVVSHDRQQIEDAVASLGEGASLAVEDLARLDLSVIARVGTPAGDRLGQSLEGQVLTAAALAGLDMVGLDAQSGLRKQLERYGAKLSRPPRVRIEAAGWDALREYVRQGLGAGVIPLAVLTIEDRKQLVIRRLPEDMALKDSLLCRPGTPTAGMQALCQALREAARGQQEELRERWRGLFFL